MSIVKNMQDQKNAHALHTIFFTMGQSTLTLKAQ